MSCLGLAVWQLGRLADRKADNALLRTRVARAPVALETVLGNPASQLDHVRVTVKGIYDPTQEVVLQSRSFRRRPGNHLLTPLILPSGSAIVVDRGWVPIDINKPGNPQAAPPAGEVTLSGILLSSENKGLLKVADPPPGRVTAIARVDLERVGKQLPYPIPTYYLRLLEQTPPGARSIPEPVPLPALSEGPHFGYAMQWLSFALTALVVYLCLLRRVAGNLHDSSGAQEQETDEAPVAQPIG